MSAIECAICGDEVTSRVPEKYPYCMVCHYTGRAAEHLRAEQIERFRKALPECTVAIEHTGGGCFWLAVYPPGEQAPGHDPKFYIATDGEANVPSMYRCPECAEPTKAGEGEDYRSAYCPTHGRVDAVDVPMQGGGWGVVCRQDYTEPEDGSTEYNEDYEGTVVLEATVDGESSFASDRYWNEYPQHCLSDEQVIAAIKADLVRRGKAEASSLELKAVPGMAGYGVPSPFGGDYLSDGYHTPEAAVAAAELKLVAPVGTRVRLKHPVDRYPHFLAAEGATGTVHYLSDVYEVKMDEHLEGAEEWDNAIQWALENGDQPLEDVEVLR